MRNYEGLAAMAEVTDPAARRSFFIIDRYLRLLNAAGILPGQSQVTGANGGGQPGAACCQNEVDEFEIVHDATKGVLGFGRAEGDSEPAILTGHTYTRIEGWEHGTQLNLNGDTTAGAVSIQTSTKRTGSYALQIVNDGVTAANCGMAVSFEGTSGHPTTTTLHNAVAFRFYMRFSALPDATRVLFTIRGAAGAARTVVSMTSGGILVLDVTSGVTALTIDTWYKITGTYDSATNKVFLLIDDGIEFNNVTAAGGGGAGTVLSFLFGKTANAGTYTMFVDDVAFEGAAAIASVTYPPSAAIYGVAVRANGQIQDVFAIAGSSPAATRWESVNIPHDGAVTNIAVTGGTDVASTYTLNVPAAVRGQIHAVQFSNFVATDTVVATTQRIVAAALDTAVEAALTQLTTTSAGTSTTAYRMYSHLRMANPFTSGAWSAGAVSAMVIGVSTTPGAGVTFRASTITIQVEVAEGSGRDFARAFRVTPDEGHIIPAYLVQDGEAMSGNWARLVAGHDGVNAQIILTDTSGRLVIVGGGGISVDLADDSAFTIATSRVVPMGALADDTATDSVDEGDIGVPRMTLDRKLLSGNELVDDAAFGVATSRVGVVGFLADETATDSVDEGDIGAARMTLDRRIIASSEHLDDAAFGIGTSRVTVTGYLADETGTDSVDEGDVGAARMTLDRRAHVKNTDFSAGAALGDTDANPTTTKVGAVTMFRNEGTTTLSRASGETHATDELGNTDDAGVHVSDIHKSFVVTLTSVSTAYDTNPETQTSASTDCRRFRYAILSFTLDSTGTPTDILFDVEMSPDNSNFYKIGWGFLQDLRYDDTVCATAINESILIEKLDRYVRLVVTATGGTGAGTKFDVTNAKITFFN